MSKNIRRNEIYWVNWNPARGSEQHGIRPALVIQNDIGNEYSPTTVVAALSTAAEKPYPFLVNVSVKESGLPKDSTVNCAVLMTIEKERLGQRCGVLTGVKMDEVDRAIKTSISLS